MSMESLGRRAQVTALLATAGALVGAATASVLSLLGTAVANATLSNGHVVYHYGPFQFAIVGALGTPIISWLLMRRVPLWRAVTEPALGGIVGTVLALAAIPFVSVSILLQPTLVLGGIVGAAIRLRSTYRGHELKSADHSSVEEHAS